MLEGQIYRVSATKLIKMWNTEGYEGEEKDHLEVLGVDGIILKWILEKL